MKNIFKVSTLLIMLIVTLQSCTKSKEEQMNEFVNVYNTSIASNSLGSTSVTTSAEITGDNEITINVITSNEEEMENQLISASIPEVLETALGEEQICKDLTAKGVELKIEVLNKNGNILNSKTLNLNKNKSDSESFSDKPKNEQLQVMLDAFNKNLPQTDKETGIKILKIKVGTDNDVIYVAEVPDDLITIFKTKETLILIKEDIVKNPQLKNVLQNAKVFKLDKIKYQYNDVKGNNLTEILITKKDLE